jgi:hypothetical protein
MTHTITPEIRTATAAPQASPGNLPQSGRTTAGVRLTAKVIRGASRPLSPCSSQYARTKAKGVNRNDHR